MLRRIFKILLFIILLITGYLAYGFYNYQKGEYRDLGVKYTIDNYNNALQNKLKIEIKDKNELFYGARIKGEGEQKKIEAFTNEEITALVNFTNESKGRIKNFQIRFLGNNEFEASFYYFDIKLGLFIPVFIKSSLAYAGGNTVYFKFNEMYLGGYKVPKILANMALNNFNLYINNTIGGMDIFEIQKLEILTNEVFFSGILPTKIEGYE